MSAFDPFERPRFFPGRLLTADDLRSEQDYQRGKARLRNRFLHGWGIVAGLEVSVDQDEVVVSPGLALDCAGNELLLPEPVCLPLPAPAARRYVSILYEEQPLAPVPSAAGEAEASAVREAVRLALSAVHPQAGHGGLPVGGPGCGLPPALGRAPLTPRGDGGGVRPAGRRARWRR